MYLRILCLGLLMGAFSLNAASNGTVIVNNGRVITDKGICTEEGSVSFSELIGLPKSVKDLSHSVDNVQRDSIRITEIAGQVRRIEIGMAFSGMLMGAIGLVILALGIKSSQVHTKESEGARSATLPACFNCGK